MTITSIHNIQSSRFSDVLLHADDSSKQQSVWNVSEAPFHGYHGLPTQSYSQSSSTTAIVIDNGASLLRAGWSFDSTPTLSFPPTVARYRDRKINRAVSYIGYDAYADATTRGQIKNAFEVGTSIVTNWDAMEGLLDYTFSALGIDGADGGLDRPVLMTETIANLPYSRSTMTELLFECYSAPSLAYGVDALFSYRYNGGSSGLVLSSSHTSTHLVPVLVGKPLWSDATRLNWGGQQAADYLGKLLKLKYPAFPAQIKDYQIEDMLRTHSYVSLSFNDELSKYLDRPGLEERDRVIQYPFTEQQVIEKSEEELARIAERKREGGRRLQEQAAKMRLEKLVRKEQELDYFVKLRARIATQSRKEAKRMLEDDELRDEDELDRTIKTLEKSVRKARNKDIGDNRGEEEPASFALLDIPDKELDDAGLKQKRHQRLMKSGVEARARAKAEKERERTRIEEEQRQDDERRRNDLDGWLKTRRAARYEYLQRIKEKEQFKADLGNRKSLASQIRMKTLANLASDTPGKKRRRGGDDDNFGANDEDWGVYRAVAIGEQSDDEEEEDLESGLQGVEAQLLKYDPDFSERNTKDAQADWRKSLIHAFRHGPRPFNAESQQECHQMHLNVERIRVPEIAFRPAIAGIDQAGILEIAADIINQRLSRDRNSATVFQDVFITGGNTLFKNFKERFRTNLKQVLPMHSVANVRQAQNPRLDAWKGAAQWAQDPAFAASSVTRDEYLEKGPEYMKEHGLGNMTAGNAVP